MELTANTNNELDPFEASNGTLVTIAFPASKSKNYGFALALVEQIARRGTKEIGGILYNVVAFEKTRRDAAICAALVEKLKTITGVMMFVDGLMVVERVEVHLTLECYSKSFLARSPEAYCTKIIDDPALKEPFFAGYVITVHPYRHKLSHIQQYSFPCKRALQHVRLQPNHGASYQDQIQAVAVDNMIHICPRFSPDNFKPAGLREAIIPEEY